MMSATNCKNELADVLATEDPDDWPEFKTTVFETAAKVIGFRKSHHKDWFDNQDIAAQSLIKDMHEKTPCLYQRQK